MFFRIFYALLYILKFYNNQNTNLHKPVFDSALPFIPVTIFALPLLLDLKRFVWILPFLRSSVQF